LQHSSLAAVSFQAGACPLLRRIDGALAGFDVDGVLNDGAD